MRPLGRSCGSCRVWPRIFVRIFSFRISSARLELRPTQQRRCRCRQRNRSCSPVSRDNGAHEQGATVSGREKQHQHQSQRQHQSQNRPMKRKSKSLRVEVVYGLPLVGTEEYVQAISVRVLLIQIKKEPRARSLCSRLILQ